MTERNPYEASQAALDDAVLGPEKRAMLEQAQASFKATVVLFIVAIAIAIFGHRSEISVTLSIWAVVLAFLVSCWCNILLVRGAFVGKSSVIIWVLVCIFGVPPLGFIAMMFLLHGSLNTIERTGKT